MSREHLVVLLIDVITAVATAGYAMWWSMFGYVRPRYRPVVAWLNNVSAVCAGDGCNLIGRDLLGDFWDELCCFTQACMVDGCG